jgi:tetratricopeptide (TPR) repeat protein
VPWAVAAALLVRGVVLAQLHDHPLLQPTGVLDGAVYVRLARQAAAGDWALGPEPYYVSPLYVYFLAFVFRFLGPSPLLAQAVQVLLGGAAVGLLAATARRLFGSGAVAGVAAWLGALAGVVVFHEVLLLQSALDPFLTALALFALVRATCGPSLQAFALAGGAFGLLVANRPNALPAAIVAAAVVVALRRTSRSVLQAAALGAGLLIAVAPFAVRNRLVAGEWILVSSHGGLNFYIGNNPEADGTYHAVPGVTPAIEGQARDARAVAEKALGRALSVGEVSGYFFGRALAWIRTQPRAALSLLVLKVAYLLNAVEVPLNYGYAYYRRDEPTLLRVLVVGSWLLVPLGLLGLVVRPSVADRLAWAAWASFVPVYGLSVALFFVSARYRLPLLVPLAVSAAAAVSRLAEWVRARRRRALAAAGAALVALCALSWWDLGLDDGLGHERSERILHHLAAGRDDAARELLARTEPLLDNPGLLYYRMGLVYGERGQPALAASFFAQALQADPGQPDVQMSLGQALLAAGRPAEAEPHLRAAREAGIAPIEASHDLARALAALGRRPEAVQVLATAIAALAGGDARALPMGLLAMSLDAPAAAERALRVAIDREPSSAPAHEALGLALAQLGRGEQARAELEEACRLDPASASARFNLAVLSLRQGRRDDARRLAAEALHLSPGYAPARGLLGALGPPR